MLYTSYAKLVVMQYCIAWKVAPYNFNSLMLTFGPAHVNLLIQCLVNHYKKSQNDKRGLMCFETTHNMMLAKRSTPMMPCCAS